MGNSIAPEAIHGTLQHWVDSDGVFGRDLSHPFADLACVCPVMNVEFDEVDELDETERGEGAYNSTGIK